MEPSQLYGYNLLPWSCTFFLNSLRDEIHGPYCLVGLFGSVFGIRSHILGIGDILFIGG